MTPPKLLLLSGMHGDEYEVIDCVKSYRSAHPQMPDHLYIPEVSPSAVARKTRRNAYGHDVNRQFFDPPKDPEVQAFMSAVEGKTFPLCINFHEDPDLAQTFYLYDSGTFRDDQLLTLRSTIIELGAGLHTGADDPMDADLGLHVEKGYISTPYDTLPQNAGFSWVWLAKHNITNRDIDIEVPGRATIELKQRIVDAVFSFFLTKDFGF